MPDILDLVLKVFTVDRIITMDPETYPGDASVTDKSASPNFSLYTARIDADGNVIG